MQCPVCKIPFHAPVGMFCPQCGAGFEGDTREKINLYLEIQDGLKNLQKVQQSSQAMTGKLEGQLGRLDRLFNPELRATKKEVPAAPPGDPAFSVPPPLPPDRSMVPQVISRKAAKAGKGEIELALGQKWFLIFGIVTMVFGIGYFLKYSIEQGWVNPFWRVVSTYCWGLAMLFLGNQFRKRDFPAFGLNIIGGGIAVLYFGAFAALQLYHLVDQGPSFLIMASITVLSGVLALRYNAVGLACIGICGGFLTPILLSTGAANHFFLFNYMLILNLAILWLSYYKRWPVLQKLGFTATYLLYSAWFIDKYKPEFFWPSFVYLNLFYLVYILAPLLYSVFRKQDARVQGMGLITLNNFLAFGYSWYMVDDKFGKEWVSLVTLAYAGLFLTLATFLQKRGLADKDAFVILIGKAALFVFLTIPFYFSGHWVTAFWMVFSAVLYWMSQKMDRPAMKTLAYLVVGFVTYKFLVYDYRSIFGLSWHSLTFYPGYRVLLVERFVTLGSVLGVTGWFAWMTRGRPAFRWFAGVMGILLFIFLNVETTAFFNAFYPRAAFAAVSVLWGLYSVVLMVLGFWKDQIILRRTAITLFAVTLLKVFTVDIARVSAPARILSFIVTGLLLTGTSFFYHRYKDRIRYDKEKQAP